MAIHDGGGGGAWAGQAIEMMMMTLGRRGGSRGHGGIRGNGDTTAAIGKRR